MLEEKHTVPFPAVDSPSSCTCRRAERECRWCWRATVSAPARTARNTPCWARSCLPLGLALARFDFQGCGESTGVEDDTTIGTRLEDARSVLKYLAFHRRLDGRLGLLGSSWAATSRCIWRPSAPMRRRWSPGTLHPIWMT